MTVTVTGHDLDLARLWQVAVDREPVELAAEAAEQVRASRRVVEDALASDRVVYGLNTGFGNFRNVVIPRRDLEKLQVNLLRSHAAGVGKPFSEPIVRAIMLLRANALACGYSGIDPDTLACLIRLLNAGVHPVVPQQGSVGASGDLAPLAHIGLVLIGEGEAVYKGKEMHASEALKAAGIGPIELHPKDGLALINGTQVISALLGLTLFEARRLIRSADVIGAMALDALLGTDTALDARIHEARPHTGQGACAQNLRSLLEGSAIRASHDKCDRGQDSYSLRCMPQVHGAVRDAVAYAERVLCIEINSSTDNPMIFVDTGEILSGGNFHGQAVAMAADFVAIALAELGAISERRCERLVNPKLSDLPAFLVKEGGLNSGLMLAQVVAAALVSENKALAHPASVDSIPTSANQEDHVSMGVTAARKAREVMKNLANILALELLCAAQALDFRRPLTSSAALEAVHRLVREQVAFYETDRPLHKDIAAIESLLRQGSVLRVAAEKVGELT